MKALTLQQPWATLIANGSKHIETRNWHPKHHPGTIAIASSKKPLAAAGRRLCEREPFRTALDGQDLPAGSFVAIAHLHHCQRTETVDLDKLANKHEGAFGDFSEGRWAWFLGPVIPLVEPVPIPNDPADRKIFKLGLWKVPDEWVTGELAAAVEALDGQA